MGREAPLEQSADTFLFSLRAWARSASPPALCWLPGPGCVCRGGGGRGGGVTAALPQRPLAFPRERAARRPRRVTGRGAGARRGEAGGWRRDWRVLLLFSRVRPERDARGSGPGRSVRAREAGLAVPRAAPLAAGHGPRRPGRPPGAMGLCCCKAWSGHLRAPKGNSRRARAPRARGFCAPGAASSGCGRGCEPLLGDLPAVSRGLPTPASAWDGLRCGCKSRDCELGLCVQELPWLRRAGWGRGLETGGSGPSWAAGPPSSLLGRRCPGWSSAGGARPAPASAPPLRLTAGSGPIHSPRPPLFRLEPRASDSISKSHGGTCEGSGFRNAGLLSESSPRTRLLAPPEVWQPLAGALLTSPWTDRHDARDFRKIN